MTLIKSIRVFLRLTNNTQLYNRDSVSFNMFYRDKSNEEFLKIAESSLSSSNIEVNKRKSDITNNKNGFIKSNLLIILLLIILCSLICVTIFLFHYFNVIHGWKCSSVKLSKITSKNDFPTIFIQKTNYSSINVKNDKIFLNISEPNYDQCKKIPKNQRFDCFPEGNANQSACENRGCCWISSSTKRKKNTTMNIPYCFYPPEFRSYTYLNTTETAYGLDAYIKRNFKSPYPKDLEVVKMIVIFETEFRLRVKFVDPNHRRFEVPYPDIPIVDKKPRSTSYSFVIDPLKTGFKIMRKSDKTVIFDSIDVGSLIISDQFLQISSLLASNYIYGLGEHRTSLLLSTKWNQLTLFNVDQYPINNSNLYGSHPFYMVLEENGNAHGVFLLNSNAMDVILQPTPAITFRTIGGILDFFFFLGPSPANVVQQYTDIVGRPFMPPSWALGFHLCRFGYKTLNETKAVLQRTINAGIPVDVQWNDLDYMSSNNDFTYNKTSFSGLPEFVQSLHAQDMHYVPLIDAGISGSEPAGTYPPYDIGMDMNIFVKNASGLPFIGKVWNTKSTVWPDFTHPSTMDYWILMLRSMYKNFEFDGAWLDMNEPSNFLSGSSTGCPTSPFEQPPYLPNVQGGQLNHKTMCMTALQYAGLHYDVHNLFGLSETILTNFALAEIRGKRPFIISRSSYSGLGHYAGHWSGDVFSSWSDMKQTIPELLSFSLFGIPLMGADICGFNGNTTASLCNRWMQLGAFYPFSRNHNTDDGIDQDPVAMGQQVVESSKKALKVRYALLPYLYTLFWKAHTDGDTVARPLFFEFNKDNKTYNIDNQFLWGSAIMITPVLKENITSIVPYFPSGLWYNYYNLQVIASKGQNIPITAPLDTIPVFIRGGSVVPQQEPKMTTTATRSSTIQLIAAPDKFGNAEGLLYWDDGESLNSIDELKFSLLNFTFQRGKLQTNVMRWSSEHPPNLGKVTILGVYKPVTTVFINQITQNFSYNTISKFLLIEKLNLTMQHPIVITWK